MFHHFAGAGGEEDLASFPADVSAPILSGAQTQPSIFGYLYQSILKRRVDSGERIVLVHLGCGSGEGVIELWTESKAQMVCIGIDSDPALFQQAHIQNPKVEIVYPNNLDDLDVERAHSYSEHIQNGAASHLLSPVLFAAGLLTSGTMGILLKHASVIIFNSTDDFFDAVTRSRLIEICSAFCAVGTLLVSLDDMAACPQFEPGAVRCAWKHVSTLDCAAPAASASWQLYDFEVSHRSLYLYNLDSTLEQRVARHIQHFHNMTMSHKAISQVMEKCREQLRIGDPVVKRRAVSGIAKTAISMILRILEQWDLLDVSSSKRKHKR